MVAEKVDRPRADRPFLADPNPFGTPTGDDMILNNNRGRQVFVEASVKF